MCRIKLIKVNYFENIPCFLIFVRYHLITFIFFMDIYLILYYNYQYIFRSYGRYLSTDMIEIPATSRGPIIAFARVQISRECLTPLILLSPFLPVVASLFCLYAAHLGGMSGTINGSDSLLSFTKPETHLGGSANLVVLQLSRP